MSNEQREGCLYIVATPIGNLQDISRRALAVLAEVDLIAAEDTRHSRRLLQHYGIDAPMQALHEHNEVALTPQLLEQLRVGRQIALISDAGTPLISDPGFPLVRACRDASIRVVPVPGASALIAALSASGLPTDRFRFEGFAPRKGPARREWLQGLHDESATLLMYESAHRIEATLADIASVFGGQRYVVLARELTKLHETFLAGPVSEVSAQLQADQQQRRGEFVLMLAGAEPSPGLLQPDLDRTLRILLDELPVKQAAALCAKLLEVSKNDAYQRALALRAE